MFKVVHYNYLTLESSEAQDDSGDSSISILDVFLPPAPTTTPGTLPPETTLTVTCPDVTCPDVTYPDVTCPDVTCPDVTYPDVTCPDVTCPDVTCPTTPITTEGTCSPCPTTTAYPDITCPDVTCPDVTCPDVTYTDVTCPEVTCPDINCPTTSDPTCPVCPTTCPTVTCPTVAPPQSSVAFKKDSYKGEIYPSFTNVLRVAVYGEEKATETTNGGQTQVAVLGVGLPWDQMVCEGLYFEQYKYSSQILKPGIDEVVLVVHATTNNHTETITYDWKEGEDDADKFSIDANTGEIKNLQLDVTPGLYSLVAVATSTNDPTLYDTTQVNIEVLVPSGNVTLDSSLVMVEVMEGEVSDNTIPISTTPIAGSVCITEVTPVSATDTFEIKREGDIWVLSQKQPLDYETVDEVRIRLKAFNEIDACPSTQVSDSQQFLRNEGLVIVKVKDADDIEPIFVEPPSDEVIAYPKDTALQKVVGPVITLQATDRDTPVVYYSLQGDDAEAFTVGEQSGAVFVEGNFQCSEGCHFTARAHDGVRFDDVAIEVLSLDMELIFTLPLEVNDVSEVTGKLEELSAQTDGASIRELYISAITTTPTTNNNAIASIFSSSSLGSLTPLTHRRTRSTDGGVGVGVGVVGVDRAAMMSLQVHVYSIKEGQLMTLSQLNEALANTNTQAEVFADKGVFSGGGESVDLTGWKAAVGVLGALLGLTIILGAGFFVYRSQPHQYIRGAYPNQSYLTDTIERNNTPQDYGTSETKDSLNGGVGSNNRYTAPSLLISQKESPPLFRSALSLEPTPPPTRSGLRRTEPGTPEYYGSSSPSPPPSYTSPPYTNSTSSTTITSKPSSSSPPTSKPLSSSTTSSSGLYSSVVTAASSSTQPKEQKETQNVPLTTFPGFEKSKPEEPAADYESSMDAPPSTSKFAGLKGSPPPKRSTAPPDSDEDEHDGLFFPGGKEKKIHHTSTPFIHHTSTTFIHINHTTSITFIHSSTTSTTHQPHSSITFFQDEGMSAEEEKKSVAFKVLVDTKEIEPENLGPSQKKAAAKSDAMDILKANKMKLGDVTEEGDEAEEGDDDDDDEEGDSKL
ncbi:hypothetical protein Pmani_032464 [Petrolisthes manimaculis]|uniref:Cadherin domain-containing protein n=1 Tax=Petrolisthes manimaculis TaxID=1843537 RepID=A0AAE1NTR3_9EUCA|nr:hypothetical protein Pmani_032464 [Petrolisthes manimaculis]